VLTTTEVAAMAGVSRHTVEREIHRTNLAAEMKAGRWIIQDDEAGRWAAQFRPYAQQRDRERRPPASPATG